jgi:hypothetical protein
MKKKNLSIHCPLSKRFTQDADFGPYLAGLIDGDGHFSKQFQCIICFNFRDISSAYHIKKYVGYGSIRKIQGKSALSIFFTGKSALTRISQLVSKHLKNPNRIQQFQERILPFLEQTARIETNKIIDWNTPWFVGFFDAGGYFQIRIIDRPNNSLPEIRLHIKIDQKSDFLLQQFKEFFGGYLACRLRQNTYYYQTVSFRQFWKVLSYFDQYSLQNHRQYTAYRLIRKAYLLVQENKHLEPIGIAKIKRLKMQLENLTQKEKIDFDDMIGTCT